MRADAIMASLRMMDTEKDLFRSRRQGRFVMLPVFTSHLSLIILLKSSTGK